MDILERIDGFLAEASKKHHPFKRKSTLDDGPRGGSNKKRKKWKCRCKNYQCVCTSGDKTIKFSIDPAYKKRYNKEYKQHKPYKYKWRPKVRAERRKKAKGKSAKK